MEAGLRLLHDIGERKGTEAKALHLLRLCVKLRRQNPHASQVCSKAMRVKSAALQWNQDQCAIMQRKLPQMGDDEVHAFRANSPG
jgi:hypothetical protein